jgi:hypothetical protein
VATVVNKAVLVPVYVNEAADEDFLTQLGHLRRLLGDVAEFLEPRPLGDPLPAADAAVFPQLLGAAYRQVPALKAIALPLLVITSEFATVSMWDWELRRFLAREGIRTIAPTNLAQAIAACRALAVKRDLQGSKFVVYQDNPGTGMQPDIFKRFFWWEDECSRRMFDKFGITVERRSWEAFAAEAKDVPDAVADELAARWQSRVPIADLSPSARRSAFKLYAVLKRDLDADPRIRGLGINCLNESRFSDTTPCLAWNLLYEEDQLIWGCEADTVSMMSEYLLNKTLGAPVMMSNLYPFLMGDAALKHEKIPYFPEVESEPENHILAAHCGYFGVVPTSFAETWTLRPRVLAIVDPNANAIDARFPTGDVTLVKLDPTFDTISAVEGQLTTYAEYPGSDCAVGAVIRVADGPAFVEALVSHHAILSSGHLLDDIRQVAAIFDLAVQTI